MTPSVTRSSTFEALTGSGVRTQHGAIRLTHLSASPDDVPELATTGRALAFTLGRRFGTAVERNRARRRLRAAFEADVDAAPLGAYLVGAQRSALTVPFSQLVESFHRCFERLEGVRP